MDLSILIPARNEMFLKQTVDDILANIRGDTEIIVVLDGQWPVEPIPDHERVTLIYHSESIGQRAATNEAAKLSNAKYVMKCDAHCAFGEGFDVIMMEDMQDDWTMVPLMKNLHAFDWVCSCGHRRYQGPTKPCDECGADMEREMVWEPRQRSPNTTSMRFDENLRFKYWGGYKPRQVGDLVETMSLLGACWMLTRDKYWELEICDERHGGWGQQGTEVACKTWLSGGRLICTKKTWFAHMFRTQGGDFGFPYPIRGSEVNKARRYSRELFLNDKWPKAKRPLQWLVDKFAPVPDWHDEPVPKKGPGRKPVKGVIYYTDNEIDEKMMAACQKQIRKGIKAKHVVSVSLKPVSFGMNICLPLERGPLTMFKQILVGLEVSDAEVIFFCEHDVLYHKLHFDFIPPERDKFYYNTNVWRVRLEDGHAMRTDDCRQTSGLCAYRDLLLEHYRKRVKMVEEGGFTRAMGFEPGTHGREERVDDYKSDRWEAEYPNIDIRHSGTMTPARWSKDEYRNQRYTEGWQELEADDELPGWGKIKDIVGIVL